MIDAFSSSLANLSGENVISIVDELDQRLRAWLAPSVPFWDDESKVLRVGAVVVKNLRGQRRGPQVKLFKAFQEAGWAKSIPNPFVDGGKPDASRLRQTVKDAKNRQRSKLISFAVGNSGSSVSWQLCEASEPSPGEPEAG